MSEPELLIARRGPVATFVFNRPARRNALTAGMLGQTVDALREADGDDAVRVVVLRGAGEQAFVSGADIAAFGSDDGVDRGRTGPVEIVTTMAAMAKPVVAEQIEQLLSR